MEKNREVDDKVEGLVQRRLSKLEEQAKPEETLPTTQPKTTWIWVLAVILLLTHVCLTVGAGQTANIAFLSTTTKFHAPYLFVFFKTLFRSASFPIYLMINTVVKLIRGRKVGLVRTLKRCAAVLGPNITWKVILIKFLPPIVLTIILQVSYTLGLANLTTSLASALATPAVATSYLMTWWFLKHPLSIVKILFVLVSFGGVALISFNALNFEPTSGTILGVSMMFVSDFALSSYQLAFKKSFPKGDLGQISFAVSGLNFLTSLVYLPVPIILKATGAEYWNWSDIPFPLLTASWSCTALSALVSGYGLTLTSGFFMGLSDLLVLTINTGIDALGRDLPVPLLQIIGSAIVGIAFVVMIMPEKVVSVNIRGRWRGEPPKTEDGTLDRLRQQSPEPYSRTMTEILQVSSSHDDNFVLPPSKTTTETEKDKDVLENQDLPIQDAETPISIL